MRAVNLIKSQMVYVPTHLASILDVERTVNMSPQPSHNYSAAAITNHAITLCI
jgi:hypothetical protein